MAKVVIIVSMGDNNVQDGAAFVLTSASILIAWRSHVATTRIRMGILEPPRLGILM